MVRVTLGCRNEERTDGEKETQGRNYRGKDSDGGRREGAGRPLLTFLCYFA